MDDKGHLAGRGLLRRGDGHGDAVPAVGKGHFAGGRAVLGGGSDELGAVGPGGGHGYGTCFPVGARLGGGAVFVLGGGRGDVGHGRSVGFGVGLHSDGAGGGQTAVLGGHGNDRRAVSDGGDCAVSIHTGHGLVAGRPGYGPVVRILGGHVGGELHAAGPVAVEGDAGHVQSHAGDGHRGRALQHNRDSVGLAGAVLRGDGVGRAVGKVLLHAAGRTHGGPGAHGDLRGQSGQVGARGHGDGHGVSGLVDNALTSLTGDGEGYEGLFTAGGGLVGLHGHCRAEALGLSSVVVGGADVIGGLDLGLDREGEGESALLNAYQRVVQSLAVLGDGVHRIGLHRIAGQGKRDGGCVLTGEGSGSQRKSRGLGLFGRDIGCHGDDALDGLRGDGALAPGEGDGESEAAIGAIGLFIILYRRMEVGDCDSSGNAGAVQHRGDCLFQPDRHSFLSVGRGLSHSIVAGFNLALRSIQCDLVVGFHVNSGQGHGAGGHGEGEGIGGQIHTGESAHRPLPELHTSGWGVSGRSYAGAFFILTAAGAASDGNGIGLSRLAGFIEGDVDVSKACVGKGDVLSDRTLRWRRDSQVPAPGLHSIEGIAAVASRNGPGRAVGDGGVCHPGAVIGHLAGHSIDALLLGLPAVSEIGDCQTGQALIPGTVRDADTKAPPGAAGGHFGPGLCAVHHSGRLAALDPHLEQI